MIETLRIRGLAVVERAELEFGSGLNVLTGETGAGKSIVLGALALLAGGRASASALRDGCDEAVVEAVFRAEGLPDVQAALAERGIEGEGGEIVVRRTVQRSGRSRAQLAGQLVPVSTLAEVFAGRIEISSQHDSHALLRPEAHGLLLDRAGGLLDLRAQVADGVAALRALDAEIERLRGEERERERRRDFLAFQVREIDEAKLCPDELASLRGERARLAHAERLREDGGIALASLTGDPAEGAERGAADQVGEAARRLRAGARVDPELAELAVRLEAVSAELLDASQELERYLGRLEADPRRLAAAEERLAEIEKLLRKYGESVEAVQSFRDAAAGELDAIEGAERRIEELARDRASREAELAARAEALSAGRGRAARRLASAVQEALRELALPQARFDVSLGAARAPDGLPCGPAGREAPAFVFSANAGEALRPLRQVASGGELSRVLLALKNAARDAAAGMVLVFDEVDAAIGGRAADRVGRALAELAGHHQVLCITHLPQIAAFADVHFRVEKAGGGGARRRGSAGRTRAAIERVEGDARIEELARMAGGEAVGEATRRHARDLLRSRARRPAG